MSGQLRSNMLTHRLWGQLGSSEAGWGQIISYFFLDHSQGWIQLSNFIKFIEVRALSNFLFITNQLFRHTSHVVDSITWWFWWSHDLIQNWWNLQVVFSLLHLKHDGSSKLIHSFRSRIFLEITKMFRWFSSTRDCI